MLKALDQNLMLSNLELGSRPAFLTICLNSAGSAPIIMSKPVIISLLKESESCDFLSLSMRLIQLPRRQVRNQILNTF